MNHSILIVYFSYQGNTRRIADKIHGVTGGDLFELRPVDGYSEDYDTTEARGRRETRDGILPELTEDCASFSGYDIVMVGTPNWFNTMAPPVTSFLSRHEWSGKTFIPFCTHGGGGVGRVDKDIAKMAVGATVHDCLVVLEDGGNQASARIAAWLDKAGIQSRGNAGK